MQLYDQDGRPLAVNPDPYYGAYQYGGTRVHTYPWSNGDQRLLNVFPLPVRTQRELAERAARPVGHDPPAGPAAAPLAVVPPVVAADPGASPSETAAEREPRRASPTASPSADSEKPRSR